MNLVTMAYHHQQTVNFSIALTPASQPISPVQEMSAINHAQKKQCKHSCNTLLAGIINVSPLQHDAILSGCGPISKTKFYTHVAVPGRN